MKWLKEFLVIVFTVFIMEFADKTQLAALAFAMKYNPLKVYIGVVTGLALCTICSVLLGRFISTVLPQKYIERVMGIVLVAAGLLMLLK